MNVPMFARRKKRKDVEEELYAAEKIHEEIGMKEERSLRERYNEITALLKKENVVPENYNPPKLVLITPDEVNKIMTKILFTHMTLGKVVILTYMLDNLYPLFTLRFFGFYKHPTPFTLPFNILSSIYFSTLPLVWGYVLPTLRKLKTSSGGYAIFLRRIVVNVEKADDGALAHELCHDILGLSEIKTSACEVIVSESLSSPQDRESRYRSLAEDLSEDVKNDPFYRRLGWISCVIPSPTLLHYELGRLYGYLLLLDYLSKNDSIKPGRLKEMIENLKRKNVIEIYREVKELEERILGK